MARRPPSRVRAHSPGPGGPVRLPVRLSARGISVIAGIERTRLWPAAVLDALLGWERLLRDPAHRLWEPAQGGCGVLQCCPDPEEVRHILTIAAHALPAKDARAFRRYLTTLAERW